VADQRPIGMRITRPYVSEDEFLLGDGLAIGRLGMILIGAPPRPPGITVRFEIVLSDGNPVFRGEGRVVAHRVHPNGRKGLEVRFTRLDSHSKAVVDRVLELRRSGSLAPAPEPDAEPSPAPERTPLPPVAAVSVVPGGKPDGPRRAAEPPAPIEPEPSPPPAPAEPAQDDKTVAMPRTEPTLPLGPAPRAVRPAPRPAKAGDRAQAAGAAPRPVAPPIDDEPTPLAPPISFDEIEAAVTVPRVSDDAAPQGPPEVAAATAVEPPPLEPPPVEASAPAPQGEQPLAPPPAPPQEHAVQPAARGDASGDGGGDGHSARLASLRARAPATVRPPDRDKLLDRLRQRVRAG
jgi:hypothetical protein